MAKRFRSVNEMVADLFGEEMAERMREQRERTLLIDTLVLLRVDNGLSVRKMAGRLGWSPGRLRRFEASSDDDLRIRDIVDYAAAFGGTVDVTLRPMEGDEAKEPTT